MMAITFYGYDTVDYRALKSWRDRQSGLVHGTMGV